MSLRVLKFGGTSMATAHSIAQCREIITDAAAHAQVAVVVSALGEVTDQLIHLIHEAVAQHAQAVVDGLQALEQRHREILAQFVSEQTFPTIWEGEFAQLMEQLRSILTGTSFVGDITDRSYAMVCSFGEKLSSRIMAYALREHGIDAKPIEATALIRTDSNYLEASVDMQLSRADTKSALSPLLRHGVIPVVTGFIGRDPHDHLTLLGRGGSDYTASIVAVSLGADAVEIWTDVDGIMSADPRVIKHVRVWDTIEMPVMAEMSFSGAKVLHPKTISAAVEERIPVFIKNTFHPDAPGTEVLMEEREQDDSANIRGIVVAKNQMLYHLSDPTILQAIGFIERCAHVFAQHHVPMDVCATSEISFSCSILADDETPDLEGELETVARTTVTRNLAKVCIIGHRIGCEASLLAQIYGVLTPYKIHTTSIDASFHNVTLLVDEEYADDILKLLHHTLFEDSPSPLSPCTSPSSALPAQSAARSLAASRT